MGERPEDVTKLLRAGRDARDALLPVVYDALRGIAERRMRAERDDHTLQATALVNEAWIKLAGEQDVAWRDRKQFYAAAAEAMRRILIDHARRVRSLKRGGDQQRVTLGAPDTALEFDPERALLLHDALDRLAEEDARAAEVTRLRFFAGLSVEETAQVLEVSERTVHREWSYARARLLELLGEDA